MKYLNVKQEENKIDFTNKYWRQNAPLNDDLDFKEQMKIIKDEKLFQREMDIEDIVGVSTAFSGGGVAINEH